nr:putative ribonuclease H-like domain-containing protein [Tanacetum cinerariifolium]
MNKLVRHNLVRGLPTKCFENDHTCTACLKGKQHKASCKSKLVNSVIKPLHTLHIDLFGPTSVSSISHKWYCLVVTDDFSRFTWTFFLKSKDETSGILKKFINEIENLKDLKVKIIRCDNGGEFKNNEMNDFCSQKGIKREFSNARTPQQNGVAERRNRTLIEADRTMLADAKLPVTFWAEAVNTVCYVQNMVLVNKCHNKTPYELFNDNLGKFEEKGDEGYFIGYSMSSKAFRVFNKRTKRVEENFHVEFLENKAIKKGAGPNWLFDIDSLTKSMNYVLVDAEFSSRKPQDHYSTEFPEGSGNPNPTASTSNPPADQMETLIVKTPIPTVSSPVLTAYSTDSQEPSKESNGVEADISNMETTITASPNPTLRIHKDHPKSQIIGPLDTLIQTRNKSKELCREFEALMHEKFQMSAMGELNFFLGIQVLQKKDGIMFAVCACARYQVTPKECHLHAVKRIFRYLKSHPKLGLWYPKESHFDRVAYSDSDYGGATQDRKSTTEGCQFLGRRLILCQCKKQTIVATSTTEAEYVVAASCCGQVLWIQNQLHDYGHHFIRDCFEKKLIDVDHIHTDENVVDLLTKPFDAGRFQYLV